MGWLLNKLGEVVKADRSSAEEVVTFELLDRLEREIKAWMKRAVADGPREPRWLSLLGVTQGETGIPEFLDGDDQDFLLREWQLARRRFPENFSRAKSARYWPVLHLVIAARAAALHYRSGTLWPLMPLHTFGGGDRRTGQIAITKELQRVSRRLEIEDPRRALLFTQVLMKRQGTWIVRWLCLHAGIPEILLREAARVLVRLAFEFGGQWAKVDLIGWHMAIERRYLSLPTRSFLAIKKPSEHPVVAAVFRHLTGEETGAVPPLAIRLLEAIQRLEGEQTKINVFHDRGRWRVRINPSRGGKTAGERGIWFLRASGVSGEVLSDERLAGLVGRIPPMEIVLPGPLPSRLRLSLRFGGTTGHDHPAAKREFSWDVIIAAHLTGDLAGFPIFQIARPDPLNVRTLVIPTESSLRLQPVSPSASEMKIPSEEIISLVFPAAVYDAIENRAARSDAGRPLSPRDCQPAGGAFPADHLSARISFPFQERFSRWLHRPTISLRPISSDHSKVSGELGPVQAPFPGCWFIRAHADAANEVSVRIQVSGLSEQGEIQAHELRFEAGSTAKSIPLHRDATAVVRLPFSNLRMASVTLVRTRPVIVDEAAEEEPTPVEEEDLSETGGLREEEAAFEVEPLDVVDLILVEETDGAPSLEPPVAIGDEAQHLRWKPKGWLIETEEDHVILRKLDTIGGEEQSLQLPWQENRFQGRIVIHTGLFGEEKHVEIRQPGQTVPVVAQEGQTLFLERYQQPRNTLPLWVGPDGTETALAQERGHRIQLPCVGRLVLRGRDGQDLPVCNVAPEWRMEWSLDPDGVAWITAGEQPPTAYFWVSELLSARGPWTIPLTPDARRLTRDDLISGLQRLETDAPSHGMFLLEPQIRYEGIFVSRGSTITGQGHALRNCVFVAPPGIERGGFLAALRRATKEGDPETAAFCDAVLEEVRDAWRQRSAPSFSESGVVASRIAEVAEPADSPMESWVSPEDVVEMPSVEEEPKTTRELPAIPNAPWSGSRDGLLVYLKARTMRLPRLAATLVRRFHWRWPTEDPESSGAIPRGDWDRLLALGLGAGSKVFATNADSDSDAHYYPQFAIDPLRFPGARGIALEHAFDDPRATSAAFRLAARLPRGGGVRVEELAQALCWVHGMSRGSGPETLFVMGDHGVPGLLDRLELGSARKTAAEGDACGERFWGMTSACIAGVLPRADHDTLFRMPAAKRDPKLATIGTIEAAAPATWVSLERLLAVVGIPGLRRTYEELHQRMLSEAVEGSAQVSQPLRELRKRLPNSKIHPECGLLRLLPLRMFIVALLNRIAARPPSRLRLQAGDAEWLQQMLEPDHEPSTCRRQALGHLHASSLFVSDFQMNPPRGLRVALLKRPAARLYLGLVLLAESLVKNTIDIPE